MKFLKLAGLAIIALLAPLLLALPAAATSTTTDTTLTSGQIKQMLHCFTSGTNSGRCVLPNVPYSPDGAALPAGTATDPTYSVPTDSTGAQVNFSATAAVQNWSDYPVGSTPLAAPATGTTAATAATLTAVSGKTMYLCGFDVTAYATSATAGAMTITGLVGGTVTYQQGVGTSSSVSSMSRTFTPCVPASATNTSVVVTSAAAGSGGATAVYARGYYQ